MYTIESFCNAIWGIPFSKVSAQIKKEEYKEFNIPKKNGTRKINYLPQISQLAELQKKLLINFLDNQPLPTCVKGFRKGESYKSFLYPHTNSTFFLRIDIKSFFPAVTQEKIKKALMPVIVCTSEDDKVKLLDLLVDIVTLQGALPQGACTSPSISNLVMARIDQRILKYCQLFDINYSRYADDLLFSSKEFDFYNKKWFVRKIKFILETQQFEINYSKTKYGRNQLILNGYVLSDNGIELSRSRLSDIRHMCSFVSNNYLILKDCGVQIFLKNANALKLKHRDLSKYPFNSVFQLSQYFCGYRAFLISLVDRNCMTTPFQKEIQKLIRRIEKQIDYLYKNS